MEKFPESHFYKELMRKKIIVSLLTLTFGFTGGIGSEEGKQIALNPLGISDPLIGHPAPPLEISKWLNGEEISLKDLRGKVVVLEFFQLWCPGCNRFSIPLMKEWGGKFKDSKEITFLSVHTVFEGHRYQTTPRLRKFVKEKGIQHPVAVDRHEGKETVPKTMKRYKTGGTPCVVILDKKGIVRFKWLGGFKVDPVEDLIRSLMAESTMKK